MDWVSSILAVIGLYIVTITIAVIGFIFAAVFIIKLWIKIWKEFNR